jgi:drug/metabolite transporter (DMT)-like permease
VLLETKEALPIAASAASANMRGAMWMIAAAAIFTFNAAIVRLLGAGGIDSLQTVFARSLAGLVIPLPFIWYFGVSVRTRLPITQAGQGAIGTLALILHFYAWTKLPFADVTSLLFTQALFVLILAAVLLGAHVSRQRWISTICGFAGALLIIRPGFGQIQLASLLPLIAAFGIALQLTLVAGLPQSEKQLTMLFYFGAIGTLMTFPLALCVWKTPTLTQAALLIGNGVLGVSSQACIFRAFRIADAAYVAPFDYSKLILAVALGFFWFGEIPGPWTLLGAAIILISTFYISRREQTVAVAS